ncbi:copper amine oxidase N-terminal domain-containing protein [Paenibacillus sp. HN-1]|uniref:copper amine oxidase N-terminal domain-containing protein n=1 Tax=Paenibacillus TaxID=44249 RepID=UPI001CA95EE0|nr:MULTISPECIES: copper amine oxidase N-terminal domain-containing protein [Paenibacillus]MBY9082422.1 copper amine oxidase N-terminal domain-containing protein [Paenibacillus sp. CGMCC 1.18879]MBY9087962.1 copper amine oxidase N-terminal domain-containing protein [Paenibacillus sinensis]
MIRNRIFRMTSALAAVSSLALLLYVPAPAGAAPALSSTLSAQSTASTNEVTLDHSGFRENGTLYIPLRDLSSFMDLQLLWNPDKRSLEVTGLYQAVSLKPGQAKAYTASGSVIMLGGETLVRSGVTYVSDKLFSKAFGMPISWKGGSTFSIPYTSRYVLTQADRQLFWLNREHGVLYSGRSGMIPRLAGAIQASGLDWVSMSARRINEASYAIDIHNVSGEPHLSNTRWRLLMYEGSVNRQGVTHYWNPRMTGLKEDVFAFQGNLVMMGGSTLRLVNPDGHIYKTYNLAEITGVDDAYAVEAIDTDFVLVRAFQKGTLFLIDRRTGVSVMLYHELLSAEDQAWLEAYPDTEIDYPGDGLSYAGRSGDALSFEWTSFVKEQKIHFTYNLPPLSL